MSAGFVGPRVEADGVSAFDSERISRDAARIVSELHGKYYEQNSRSRVFFGSSASTGIAIIAPAAGGGHPTLWNPSDSGRNLSIIRLELSYVSGNNAPGALEWAAVKSTGNAVATGAAIATLTRVVPSPGLIGGAPGNPKGVWSPTVNTFTAAPVFERSAGLGLFTGVAATAVAPFRLEADYDGDFVIAPGTAICLCDQTTTTTALFQVTLTWEEVDITASTGP